MQAHLSSLHMTSETTGWGLILGGKGEYRVIYTRDGGQSWKAAGIWELGHGHLDFFPLSEQMALALTGRRVYRTTDAGTTWQEGSLPLAANEGIWIWGQSSLTFSDAQHGWLLLAPDMSTVLLLQTVDGGLNFRQVLRFSTQKPPAPGIGATSALQFLDQQTGWITAAFPALEPPVTQRDWLYLTQDGGNHWTPQSFPLPPGVKPTCGLRLGQPRFFSMLEGIIPAAINHSQDGTPNGFLVFVTQDGGRSWQSRPFVPKDYNHVYDDKCRAMAEERLKRGEKGGGERLTIDLFTPAPQWTSMQFGWVGWPSLELLTTHDGGEHWEPLAFDPLPQEHNPPWFTQVQFLNSRVGWVVTRGVDYETSHLYKTSDGGKTWTPLPATLRL